MISECWNDAKIINDKEFQHSLRTWNEKDIEDKINDQLY